MTAPAVAWACSLHALGLGAGLGCFFGFLRPLARRLSWLADSIFLAAMVWVWTYHSFAVCGGDPRIGYLLAAFLGNLGWERTVGKKLRPLWEHIWNGIGGFWRTISRVLKNIFKILKKMFASSGKWGTIKRNNRLSLRRVSGGESHGKVQSPLPRHQGGICPQSSPDQGGGDCAYSRVYGGADHPELVR